jgi:hypothetical protein
MSVSRTVFSPVLSADVTMLLRGTACMADTCDVSSMYLRLGNVNIDPWRCLQVANEVSD